MTSADDAGVVEDMKDVLDFILFMIIFVFQIIIAMIRGQIAKQNVELHHRQESWQIAEAAGFLIFFRRILKTCVTRQPDLRLTSEISHFLRIK